ncbi:MAG: hypothetical protein LH645_04890 [Actinomycetia bacterium]|nr:hypothetical protein [Actinomycetes bacterium]
MITRWPHLKESILRRLVLLPLLGCALVMAGCTATTVTSADSGPQTAAELESAGGRAGEASEEANLTEERLDALAAAKAEGTFGGSTARSNSIGGMVW